MSAALANQTPYPAPETDYAREVLAHARTELEIAATVRVFARSWTIAEGTAVIFKRGARVAYVDEDAIGPLWKGQDFPIEACISGWAISHRETVVIENIYDDPRIPVEAYKPTFVNSLAIAPVRPADPIAAVGAYWARRALPNAQQVRDLELAAALMATALERIAA